MARVNERGLSESITGQAAILSELVATYIEASLRSSGLSLGSFELLSAVKASPSATQAEIAARLGITPSSLCEAVRSASDKGLVEQESSMQDRRAKRVALTRKGSNALDKALKALEEAEQKATEGLSPNRLNVAIETLRQASRNLRPENLGS
jgi:DNA-binding MarR family transcriptional regulator